MAREMIKCPFCECKVLVSEVEKEDGACPECGQLVMSSKLFDDYDEDDEDLDYEDQDELDDEFDDEFDDEDDELDDDYDDEFDEEDEEDENY